MHLIPEWRRAPRMLSVQMAALAVAWGVLPVDTQSAILALVGVPEQRVPAVLGLLMLVGRLIDQPKVRE